MAIRSKVGDLNKMKKAIYASLFHCAIQKKTITMRTGQLVLIVGAHTTLIQQIKRNYVNLPRDCQKKPLKIKRLVHHNINIERLLHHIGML